MAAAEQVKAILELTTTRLRQRPAVQATELNTHNTPRITQAGDVEVKKGRRMLHH